MDNKIIPTYIINLEKRIDRKLYIQDEFRNRPEFDVNIVKAIEDEIPAIGLYKSLIKIILVAKEKSLPYVLICEDDHQFTQYYNEEKFINSIINLNNENVGVYLGGISWFDYAFPVKSGYYCVNSFNGTQFMVIYSRNYDVLLNAEFDKTTTIDVWIAKLTTKIYVSVPMLSVQKDFGYSDVTSQNDKLGIVEEYFIQTNNRWKALEIINEHIKKVDLLEVLPEEDCVDLVLPTYLINEVANHHRLQYIKNQFKNKNEFHTQVLEVLNNSYNFSNSWNNLLSVVSFAKEKQEEVILVCWDNHEFQNNYDKRLLFTSVYQGAYLAADIILGGVSKVRQAIPVNNYLCWLDRFEGSQFVIIYNHFFDIILNESYHENEFVDSKLSNMTINKYVIHPFISTQKEFDENIINSLESVDSINQFESCEQKIDMIRIQANQY